MVVGERGMSFPESGGPPDHALAPTATPPPAGVPPRNERPVRGDNRTGQSHMGRLGWMGARAEYSHGEELPAPTHIGRRRAGARSKRPAIFLTLRKPVFGGGIPIVRPLAGCRPTPRFPTSWSRQPD